MAAKPWESSFPGIAREHVSVMNVMEPNLEELLKLTSPEKPKSFFVKKRSLSIPESMLSNLESILSPSKTTPPPLLPSLAKLNSMGSHHITTNSLSPSSRSLAVAFDANQPLLSSPYRLRVSIPTLNSHSPQKSPLSHKGLAIVTDKEGEAIIDKKRIVVEALKGFGHSISPLNVKTLSKDEVEGGSITKVEKEKSYEYERRSSNEQGTVDVGNNRKVVLKRDQATKVRSNDQELEISYVPGYMQSTESAKAKIRQINNASPGKKQEASVSPAPKRRNSLSRSDLKLSSPSSQRFISNVRTNSSRAFKDNMHVASVASEDVSTRV